MQIGPNVSIGPKTVIGSGVRIKDSIILDGVEIKANSCILSSVIGWNSRVGCWTRVEGTPSDQPSKLMLNGQKTKAATIIGTMGCFFL
jgi:mannose-1-phosphate guanylyltransferase